MAYLLENNFRILKWKFNSPLVFPNSTTCLSDGEGDVGANAGECESCVTPQPPCSCPPSNYRLDIISTKAFRQFGFVTLTFDMILTGINSCTDQINLCLPLETCGYYQNSLISKEFSSYENALRNIDGAIVMGTVSACGKRLTIDAYQFDSEGLGTTYRITGQIVYEAKSK